MLELCIFHLHILNFGRAIKGGTRRALCFWKTKAALTVGLQFHVPKSAYLVSKEIITLANASFMVPSCLALRLSRCPRYQTPSHSSLPHHQTI